MLLRPPAWMSNWSVRTKLVAVLVPLALGVVGFAGFQIRAQEAAHSELVSAQRAMEVSARAWDVMDALQYERTAVLSYIHSGRASNAPLMEAVQRVDTALAALRLTVATDAHLAPDVQADAEKALTELAGLDALRRTVQQTRYPDVSAFTRYSQILEVLVLVGRRTAESVSALPIGADVTAIQTLGAAQEHLARQNALLLSAANTRDLPPEQANQLRAAQSRFDAAVAEFNATADIDLRQRYQDTVSGSEVDERSRLIQLALVQSDSPGRSITVSAAETVRTGDATTRRIGAVRLHVTAGVTDSITALATQARRSTVITTIVIAAVLLIAFAMATGVARSILRPLRVLRLTALRVAKHDLPDAIDRILAAPEPLTAAETAIPAVPIHSREEVGQVARAFDVVHAAAVRQATRHAVLRDGINAMLANLARRSQALVERQISVIDRLEKDEQDPDQLAELFRLDHLATRMRRNSENLLVLSGAGLSTRLAQPVPLHDVLGLAVSEAEDFARVKTDVRCEVSVLGHVVKDLARLLAELLDNATAVSNPKTDVTLCGALTRTRDVVIEVRDCGIGMAEDEIEQVNCQLAQPPDIEPSMAERMGLHVVARLAHRHDITVSLRANDDLEGGITAKVLVPATLLVAPPAPAQLVIDMPTDSPPERTRAKPDVDLFQPQQPVNPADPAATLPNEATPTRRPHAEAVAGVHARPPQTHPSRADSPPSAGDSHAADSEPLTQRLAPVEGVLSQWFMAPRGTGSEHASTADKASRPTTSTATSPSSGPTVAPRRTSRRASWATASWSSPGDHGWDAANTILTNAKAALESPNGLPKRVPKEHLLPGSPLASTAAPAQGIDPQRTRQSLNKFQQGVQRARNEATPPMTDDPSTEVTDR